MNLFALIGALVRVVQRLLRPPRSAAEVGIGATRDLTRARSELIAENALLRQQLIVLRRSIERPRLHRDDRVLLLALARLTRRWRDAILRPAGVVAGRPRPKRPHLSAITRTITHGLR